MRGTTSSTVVDGGGATSVVLVLREGRDGATAETCPADAGPETAARVQARYDGIRDLTADFEQQSRSASFGGQPCVLQCLMNGSFDQAMARVAFAAEAQPQGGRMPATGCGFNPRTNRQLGRAIRP